MKHSGVTQSKFFAFFLGSVNINWIGTEWEFDGKCDISNGHSRCRGVDRTQLSTGSLKYRIRVIKALPTYFPLSRCLLTIIKDYFYEQWKQENFVSIWVSWINFEVYNENILTNIWSHKGMRATRPTRSCFQHPRSSFCALLSFRAAWLLLQKQWLLPTLALGSPAAQIRLQKQQISETAEGRSRAIASQRCHWTVMGMLCHCEKASTQLLVLTFVEDIKKQSKISSKCCTTQGSKATSAFL